MQIQSHISVVVCLGLILLITLTSAVNGKTLIIRGDGKLTDLKANLTSQEVSSSEKSILTNNLSDGSIREVRAAYNPLGTSNGEGSQPRRRSRSPSYTPFGRASGEDSQPRRKASRRAA